MNKVEMHKSICDELNKLYSDKNHDYGDSYAKAKEEFPEQILMMIFHKYYRLKTLYRKGEARVGETIEDSLMDLANYCIMELIERRYDELRQHEHDVFDENFRLETYKQMKRREFRNWIKSFMKK